MACIFFSEAYLYSCLFSSYWVANGWQCWSCQHIASESNGARSWRYTSVTSSPKPISAIDFALSCSWQRFYFCSMYFFTVASLNCFFFFLSLSCQCNSGQLFAISTPSHCNEMNQSCELEMHFCLKHSLLFHFYPILQLPLLIWPSVSTPLHSIWKQRTRAESWEGTLSTLISHTFLYYSTVNLPVTTPYLGSYLQSQHCCNTCESIAWSRVQSWNCIFATQYSAANVWYWFLSCHTADNVNGKHHVRLTHGTDWTDLLIVKSSVLVTKHKCHFCHPVTNNIVKLDDDDKW